MTGAFDLAFSIVVSAEGGYVNDPADPGGETKYGITKRDHPQLDIGNLTLDQARAIYEHDYWNPCHCDDLPPLLAVLLFDAAVNQGVGAAVRLLQKAAGLKQDGIIGPATLRAVAAIDLRELCSLFQAERALRYFGTANFAHFGRGWLKRLFVTQATVFAAEAHDNASTSAAIASSQTALPGA